MLNLLPVLGLVLPPSLYLIFLGINSSVFSSLGLSGDNMLITVAVASAIIWLWAAFYARSTNNFFKKQDAGNFKQCFGIHGVAETLAIFVWLFGDYVSEALIDSVSGMSFAILVQVIFMFVFGNILRTYLTSRCFKISLSSAINANKVVFIFEILFYTPAALYFSYTFYNYSSAGL